jgi:hypothetical protein
MTRDFGFLQPFILPPLSVKMVHECLTRSFPLSTLAIQAWKQLLLCFLMFVLCCFDPILETK